VSPVAINHGACRYTLRWKIWTQATSFCGIKTSFSTVKYTCNWCIKTSKKARQ